MKSIASLMALLWCLTTQANAWSWCPKSVYDVRNNDKEFAVITFKSNPAQKIVLPFAGCRRTYDMLDCLYANDDFVLYEVMDNGLGAYGGLNLLDNGTYCESLKASAHGAGS